MKNRFYKILSIILSVAMVFSVCGIVANATETEENVYYVMSGGTGDGRTESSPLATVADAIALINDDGLDADDTAIINVMQRSDWDAVTNADGTWNLTSWAAYEGSVESHTATIVVRGYGTRDKWGNINLAYHDKPGKGQAMMIMGPTVFEGVMLVCPRYDYDALSFNGNSVTFESDVKYMRLNGSWKGTEFSDNENTGFPGLYRTLGNHGANEEYDKPVNIVFNNKDTGSGKGRQFYLGAQGKRTHSYAEDVTITVNNSSTSPWFIWGNYEGSGGITFGKNLNFNIISAATVNNSITNDNAKAASTPFAVNGGIQILLNSADAWSGDISSFSNVNAAGGIFKLLNKTGVTDILEFTATAGVYKIKDGYTVAAYDADGKEYPCVGGYLRVPAGEYTVKDYTPPVTNDYYVMYGGKGDGKSADSPVATVADAIALVNKDGLSEGDTANIYVMQNESWTTAAAVGEEWHLTSWSNSEIGVPESHTATIVVQGYGDVTDSYGNIYLAYHELAGTQGNMMIMGPTIFKNIRIVSNGDEACTISLNGNSVTFGAGTAYYRNNKSAFTGSWKNGDLNIGKTFPGFLTTLGNHGADATYSEPIDIVFEGLNNVGSVNKNRMFYLGGTASDARTHTFAEDVTVTVDNASTNHYFYLGKYSADGGAVTFSKNLNLNIVSATSLGLSASSTPVTVAGGIQIINSAGITWTDNISTATNVTNGGYWYLNNTTKLGNLVEFTATAGTFAVREGYAVKATNDATGATTDSKDGYLVLAAGSYTLTAEKLPETVNYYVKNGGAGDGRTAENPAATVYDAIVSVNEDGLIAGDTAIINIMQRTDWNASKGVATGPVSGIKNHEMTSWTANGGNVPAHTATIVVQAYNTALDTYLVFSERLGANDAMGMFGPTIFKNIRLVSNRGIYNAMWLNGQNVTFGEGTKYGTLEVIATGSSDNTWDGTVKNQDSLAMYTVSYGDSPEIDYDVTQIFENAYTSKSNNTNHGIRFSGHNGKPVFNKDVNIIVNNADCAPQMYFGNGNSGSTTINGNLNILVRDGKGFTMTEGASPVYLNGNVQIVLNKGGAYSGGNITEYSNVTMGENSKYWFVAVSTNLADALALTETDGTYKVADGYVAVATNNATGVQTLSADGLLTIAPGEYTVEVVDSYTNDGEIIRVYKDRTNIDLQNEFHLTKEGKLFIGWAKADGSWASRRANYNVGTVLTAQYIDINTEDFAVEESQIRTEGDLGLRFVVNYNKETIAKIPNIQKFGTISLPLDLSEGRELFLDTPVTLTWTWDESNKNDFTPLKTGATPVEVIASNILEESETDLKYTLCITDIEADKYNMFYAVRGYIYFKNYNGVYDVVYTENAQSSLYKVASEAIKAGESNTVYNDIVEYVEGTWNVNYLANDGAIKEYLTGVEGSYDTNPNHLMYRLNNGLIVRDITVKSGITSDPVEIAFMADAHFNYVNEYDIATRSINALSSYRGRSWLRDGSSVTRTLKAMKYASIFDKIVIGGDAIDYLSWGSQSVVENIFTKQSVNNNIMMALGNHELSETMQADISGLDDIMTLIERYNRIQTSWANDVYYHEEIVDNKIMTVVLDNGNGGYLDSQIAKLNASIAKAKSKGLKILIFQHIPMLTMNPNETCIYGIDGIDNDKFGTPSKHSFTRDMTSFHGYMGGKSHNSEATLEVCSIIRQNPDVIAGVFTGHEHANMFTEIAACDAEGNLLYDNDGNLITIPQHVIAGVHYGTMAKITIE